MWGAGPRSVPPSRPRRGLGRTAGAPSPAPRGLPDPLVPAQPLRAPAALLTSAGLGPAHLGGAPTKVA